MKNIINEKASSAAEPTPLSGVPRRTFLASLAALGAGTLISGCATDASTPAAAGGEPHRIDVHHHLLPPKYVAELPQHVKGENPPRWSPASSIEDMDKNGIATSMTSLMQPQVWFGDVPLGRRLARESNDYAATLARDYPGRYGIFATLPLPDVDGSLREIEYAIDVLKADGFGLMTSYAGKYLGEPAFWPVWEELNRRKAIVYNHPLSVECCRNPVAQYIGNSAIEYATDTTRMIASLLFSGAAARFPDIRWIHSHGGGTMPFLYSRFTRQEASTKNREQLLPNGVLFEVKKFYYETAQANHPGALAALLKLVSVSQVMFGTDFPYRPGAEAIGGLTAYGFTPADLAAIDRGNAVRLMPRWKA
ncbi:MAG: TIM-barrel fold metal-dependent hydrolase [Betaproteobacteria bacterium]|nr:TIM-barrel fold metal-dependent hydrolase [Betaproteobacteria bacterium]